MLLRNDILDAPSAKRFEPRIGRVADAVAEEDEDVARRHVQIEFIKGGVVEWTQWQSGRLHDLGPPRMAVDRSRQSRVRDPQRAVRAIPYRVDHRNVLRADGPLA